LPEAAEHGVQPSLDLGQSCHHRVPGARMSERFDFGVLVSPVLLALRQTWITPPVTSTCAQVS
jgi:hypothetical protein